MGYLLAGLPHITHCSLSRFIQATLRRACRRSICFWCALFCGIGIRRVNQSFFWRRFLRLVVAEDAVDTLMELALVAFWHVLIILQVSKLVEIDFCLVFHSWGHSGHRNSLEDDLDYSRRSWGLFQFLCSWNCINVSLILSLACSASSRVLKQLPKSHQSCSAILLDQ